MGGLLSQTLQICSQTNIITLAIDIRKNNFAIL